MIQSRGKRIMIPGIGQQAATRYKGPDETIKQGNWMVADGKGGAVKPVYVFGCYDTTYGIAWDSAVLASLSAYDLSGEVVPAGYTVHLSKAGHNAAPAELAAGEFATVQSDDTGTWSYEGLEGFDGTLYAWIKVDANVLDMLDAGVSASLAVTIRQETTMEGVQYAVLAAPTPSSMGVNEHGDRIVTDDSVVGTEAGKMDWPTITITGSRPSPAPVYVSKHVPGEPLTVESLTASTVAAVEAGEDSAYTAVFDDVYVRDADAAAPTHEYVVWSQTETPGLTASMTCTNNMCLSGDTLITMADGTMRRLDEVQPGDLLLAGDGTPTRALRVDRGRWNDHHTLYHFEDGTTIDEIHDHRFYNCEQGFWQLLRRWNIGDHARRQDGVAVALVAVERVDEPAEMFGLWTESRDYWANGLLSGETAANQALLADATAEQAVEMMASLEERAILQLLGGLEGLLP